MKSKWIETTVGEIADAIQYGYTESSTIQNVGPKFLRITDIQNGKVDWQTVPYCQCDELDKYKLQEGDILFARTGATTGKSFLVKDCPETVFASYLIRVRLKREILPNYVYQFFQTPAYWNQIKQFTTGSTQGGFNASKLADIRIPLPPLSIQQQIAAILEKADAAREKRRQANRLTEQFLQSAFLEMFGDPATNPKGWEMKKFDEVCDIRRGASPRPIDEYMGGTVPWIKIGDGSNDSSFYIETTAAYVTEEGAKKSVYVPAGSLIFANCGVSLGFARIMKIGGCIHDGWLALSNLRSFITDIYLLSVINLMTPYFRRIAPGGTQPNLNTTILGKTSIPIPPYEQQMKFKALIEKVESLRAKQRQSERELEHLFNSLMQRAFRGELVGNDRE